MNLNSTDPYPRLGSFSFTFRSLDAHGIGISASSNFAVLYEAAQNFLKQNGPEPLDRAKIAMKALLFERRLADGAALAADDVYPISYGGVIEVTTLPFLPPEPSKKLREDKELLALYEAYIKVKPVTCDPHWLAEQAVIAFEPNSERHDVPKLLQNVFDHPNAANNVERISALAAPAIEAIVSSNMEMLAKQICEYKRVFNDWTGGAYTKYSNGIGHDLRDEFQGSLCEWKPPGGGATRSIAAFFRDNASSKKAIKWFRDKGWWANPLLITDGVSQEVFRSDGDVRFTAGHRLDFIGAADLGQDWRIGKSGSCVSCAIEPRTELVIIPPKSLG